MALTCCGDGLAIVLIEKIIFRISWAVTEFFRPHTDKT